MAFIQTEFNNFINKLKSYQGNSTVNNQYANQVQLNNIMQYLLNIEIFKPTILLVGEAPGYNGCAKTGIPFSSEYIIHTHNNSSIFSGCKALGTQKEPTATIVWQKLDEINSLGKLSIPPLIWNIFPFHPHKIGILNSNREPITSELKIGYSFLIDLINLFPSIKQVYAIGQTSSSTIRTLPHYAGVIRHPSNGGKPQFCKEIDYIYS